MKLKMTIARARSWPQIGVFWTNQLHPVEADQAHQVGHARVLVHGGPAREGDLSLGDPTIQNSALCLGDLFQGGVLHQDDQALKLSESPSPTFRVTCPMKNLET